MPEQITRWTRLEAKFKVPFSAMGLQGKMVIGT